MFRSNMFQTEKEWCKMFAGNLKDIMCEINYTQTRLAKEADISQSALSRYLKGERAPSLRDVMSICKVLKISANELINYDSYIL